MQIFPNSLLEKLGFEQLRQAVLNETQSVRTRELINGLHPTSHRQTVHRLLKETDEMMRILRNPDPFPLNGIPDVTLHLKQAGAEGSVIPLHAFVEILHLIKTARFVKAFFHPFKEDYPYLQPYAEELIPLKELEKQITAVVTESGELKDTASTALRAIRARMNKKKNELRSAMNRIMRNAVKDGMASEEGITLRNGRMVIPVLAEYKRKIQGFVHDVSATGQTVYLEPVEALQLNNEIRQAEAEEQQEIERILRELTGHVRLNRAFIAQNLEGLAQLELIAAKAKISIRLDAEIPIISPNLNLKLKRALNTSLLLKNLHRSKEQKIEIVPLFLELSPKEQCLIITGPNAGGKSVAMKTVGIFALMVQSGFAIPADPTSEIPLFSGVFVDLGDDQSIENDLSTFSSRLHWMQETISNIKVDALVLIDEAATGTDPDEGGALFQAFIEYLLKRPGKVIATTHHGSLKVFAHEHPLAVNGSMEFDQQTLSPTYKFKKGVPGSSYAFEIAGRMKISRPIIQRSTELLGETKNKMESLIIELENKAQQAEELQKKLNVLKGQTEAEHRKYRNKHEALEKEKEKIKEKALIEAKAIMDEANRKVEQAVEEILSMKTEDKEKIKEIRSGLDLQKRKVGQSLDKIAEKKEARSFKQNIPPKPGDFVRFKDGSTTGELIEVKGSQALVQADGLRLKTKYKNLIKSNPPKKHAERARIGALIDAESTLREAVKPALDVRGQRTDQALKEVMYYLDRALFHRLKQVEIIHGLGDGILKSQIHSYLNERKEVAGFHAANEDYGGAGCTIVQLK